MSLPLERQWSIRYSHYYGATMLRVLPRRTGRLILYPDASTSRVSGLRLETCRRVEDAHEEVEVAKGGAAVKSSCANTVHRNGRSTRNRKAGRSKGLKNGQ